MRTKENRSALKDLLSLGARIAAPVALSYLLRNVIRPRGNWTPLSRDHLDGIHNLSEKRFAQQMLEIQKEVGPDALPVYHEPVMVTTKRPVRIGEGKSQNKTVPDFLINLRGNPGAKATQMLGVELTLGEVGCDKKLTQRQIMLQEGLINIAVGPDELSESEATSDIRAKAMALLGHFSPFR